jgi:hypothetical protein
MLLPQTIDDQQPPLSMTVVLYRASQLDGQHRTDHASEGYGAVISPGHEEARSALLRVVWCVEALPTRRLLRHDER